MKTSAFIMPFLTMAVFFSLPGCSKQEPAMEPAETAADKSEEAPGEATVVVLQTSRGDIHLRLMPETAPRTVENFKGLAERGYYDGTVFHRVIKDFMVQGGDPQGTGMGGDSLWGGSFEDEFDEDITFDRPGILAMANSGPNSNRSQFFITTAETPWLNMRHTIFGEVVSGMETLKAIENSPTGRGDRPVEEQKINRAYILK